MVARGSKPKPARLRLVDGTHRPTRHGAAPEIKVAVETAAKKFGALVKPGFVKGQAAWAWRRYIEPAAWLDASREAAAIAFCELWKEFREAPQRFPSSKHGQMRAYMAELGLTDERNRSDDGSEKEVDEFFGPA